MLNSQQRETRYLAQTGRAELTPRQMRRTWHKARHQGSDAVAAREEVSAERAKTRAERKRQTTTPTLSPR